MANATYLGLDRSGWRGVGTGATIGGGALSIYGTLRSGKEAEAAGRQSALIINRNAMANHFETMANSTVFAQNAVMARTKYEEQAKLRRLAIESAVADVTGRLVGRGMSPNSESAAAIRAAMYREAEEAEGLAAEEMGDVIVALKSQQADLFTQDTNAQWAAHVEAQTAIARGKAARLASYGQAAGQGLSTLGSLATFGMIR